MPFVGKHVIVDIIDFKCTPQDGHRVFQMMKETIFYTCPTMRVVGESKYIFEKEFEVPGFSHSLNLDSSHFCVHSYSQTGLLAIDIFTCEPEKNPPLEAMLYFLDCLKEINPNYKIAQIKDYNRFPNTIV